MSYSDPNTYVVLSFLLFLYVFVRFALKTVLCLIDEKIRAVKHELESIYAQKEQISQSLETLQLRMQHISDEAAKITQNAHDRINILKQQYKQQTLQEIAIRQQKTSTHMRQLQMSFEKELYVHIVKLVLVNVKKTMQQQKEKTPHDVGLALRLLKLNQMTVA